MSRVSINKNDKITISEVISLSQKARDMINNKIEPLASSLRNKGYKIKIRLFSESGEQIY